MRRSMRIQVGAGPQSFCTQNKGRPHLKSAYQLCRGVPGTKTKECSPPSRSLDLTARDWPGAVAGRLLADSQEMTAPASHPKARAVVLGELQTGDRLE